VESSTTENVCNGAITDSNECQDIALLIASSRLHGGKPNRIRTARPPRTDARSNYDLAVSSHVTITSATRITKMSVTRDFGNYSPGSPCRIRRSNSMLRPSAPSNNTASP
jgi:hypothetical protein